MNKQPNVEMMCSCGKECDPDCYQVKYMMVDVPCVMIKYKGKPSKEVLRLYDLLKEELEKQ